MADFDVNTITAAGATLIASATAGNKLVIDGCDATTDVLTKAQAVQVSTRPATPGSNTTEVALAGSTDNHVYAYAEFIRGQSTGGDFNTFYLYGHIQNSPSVVRVIAIASASSPTHLPVSGDVTNRTELQFELTFSATDEVVTVADSSMYTTRGEFLLLKERVVTTHAEGTPTTGEAQTIYGNKSFADGLSLSALSGISSNPITLASTIVPQGQNAKLGSYSAPFSEIVTGLITGPADLNHGIYIQTNYSYGQAGQYYDSDWHTSIDHKKFKTQFYMAAQDNNGTETSEDAGIRLSYNGTTKASIGLSYSKTLETSKIEFGGDRFDFGATIYINSGSLSISGDVIPQSTVTSDLGDNSRIWNDLYVNRVRIPNVDLCYDDNFDGLKIGGSIFPSQSGYGLGSADWGWYEIFVTGAIHFGGGTRSIWIDSNDTLRIDGSLIPDAGSTYSLGSSGYTFDKIYSDTFYGNLRGCIPTPSNNTSAPPVGVIFLARVNLGQTPPYTSQALVPGDAIDFTVASPTFQSIQFARFNFGNNLEVYFAEETTTISSGKYQVLSGGDNENGPGSGQYADRLYCLVMRIQ